MTDLNRYQQGKNYRLIDLTSGMYYIGSTCLSRLNQRYHIHKSAFSINQKRITKFINILLLTNSMMVVLESS